MCQGRWVHGWTDKPERKSGTSSVSPFPTASVRWVYPSTGRQREQCSCFSVKLHSEEERKKWERKRKGCWCTWLIRGTGREEPGRDWREWLGQSTWMSSTPDSYILSCLGGPACRLTPSSVNNTPWYKWEIPLSQSSCIGKAGPFASLCSVVGESAWSQDIWTQMAILSGTSYITSTKSFTTLSLRFPISEMKIPGRISDCC